MAKFIKALSSYTARAADELSFRAGDVLKLLDDGGSGCPWMEAEMRGESGFVPTLFFKKTFHDELKILDVDGTMDNPCACAYVTACYSYKARKLDELSFKKGDRVKVLDIGVEGLPWMSVELDGVSGFVPSNFFIIPKNAVLPKKKIDRHKIIEAANEEPRNNTPRPVDPSSVSQEQNATETLTRTGRIALPPGKVLQPPKPKDNNVNVKWNTKTSHTSENDPEKIMNREEEILKEKEWYTTKYVASASSVKDFKRILLARDTTSGEFLYPNGAFLVSRTIDNKFAVSIRSGSELEQYKILHDLNTQFFIWVSKFPTITSLINYHTETTISRHTDLKLKKTKIEVD